MFVNDLLYIPAEAVASELRMSTGWDEESSVLVVTTGITVSRTPVSPAL